MSGPYAQSGSDQYASLLDAYVDHAVPAAKSARLAVEPLNHFNAQEEIMLLRKFLLATTMSTICGVAAYVSDSSIDQRQCCGEKKAPSSIS